MDAAAVLKERFELREITPEKYRTMGSPMMRFHLEQYAVEGLGNLCVLRTRAMLGLMKLVTVVVTPNTGKNVPFLLIDTMDMGKKHLCYVEYYDCTAEGADRDLLLAAGAPYADIENYAEKPAWYVSERMKGSLIKTGDRARLDPFIDDAHLAIGSGVGEFEDTLRGLMPNMMYYLRAYAMGNNGAVYGQELTFMTLVEPMAVQTGSVSDIVSTRVRCEGCVIRDGDHEVTERGFCYGLEPNPTVEGLHVLAGRGMGTYEGKGASQCKHRVLCLRL